MKIKKLEFQSESKGLKRIIQSQSFKRSVLSIIIGAVIGFGFFYFTEARHMNAFSFGDGLKSTLIGGFIGFFVTNSPCARNQC